MPWLVKPEDPSSGLDEHLLFVHVPRCGGTSLTKHFSVPEKAMEGRSWWGRLGMGYFFHRYQVLESANFPIKTKETAVALLLLLVALAVVFLGNSPGIGYALLSAAIVMFVATAFLFTAPFIGRITWVRRPYLYLVHDVLFRFMESIEWLTGTNKTGYMMHLTSRKLLSYGYVTPEQMDGVSSMAIVRNPYSRMVSVYMYNRYGPWESFGHFVKDWYAMMRHYRESGETEEWYTPCHCIPQHEFTHFEGKQLVQSVVKQEELKYLKHREDIDKAVAEDNTVTDLPEIVRDALLGMPHTNSRKTTKKWYEYYNQETLNLTYELYKMDFMVFGYSAKLEQRPDLLSAAPAEVPKNVQTMRRNSSVVAGRRVSKMMVLKSASKRSLSLRGSFVDSLLVSGGGFSSVNSNATENTSLMHPITEDAE